MIIYEFIRYQYKGGGREYIIGKSHETIFPEVWELPNMWAIESCHEISIEEARTLGVRLLDLGIRTVERGANWHYLESPFPNDPKNSEPDLEF